MGTIEVVINYICLSDEANGFCRYLPELTSKIEIDDPSWDGYTQLVVRQPKNAVLWSAGSLVGAEERFVQVSPLPLRTSAPLLATTQSLRGEALEIASPLACPLHTHFLRANDYERYSLYLYGTAMNLECKP
ncbi:hypothetical protein [Anabaena sp. CCY 9910]|uniref:hypothetical protein n=1 Tax=Anabaena sp. CCY 9910 TaxID=3103870 RepID=UPI0039DFD39E